MAGSLLGALIGIGIGLSQAQRVDAGRAPPAWMAINSAADLEVRVEYRFGN